MRHRHISLFIYIFRFYENYSSYMLTLVVFCVLFHNHWTFVFILIRHTRTQKLSERYWSYCRQRKNKYAGVLEGTDWDSSLQVNLYIWWKVLNVWELSKIDGMIYISFEKKTHHISSLCTQLNCQTFSRVFKGLRSKTVINTCI